MEDVKSVEIMKKQVGFSVQIVEKWDQLSKSSENVLLDVIAKVNRRLPVRKL